MTPGLETYRPDAAFDELHDRLAAVAAAAGDDEHSPPEPGPEPPPKKPKPGRTADGKFDRGNPGGPGNPFARQVASFREALYEAVTRDMLKDLAARLWGMAMGGNVAAARLLLQHLVGKPQDPPNPDRLDRDEWQCHQSDAVPGQEFNQLMASMPVGMAVHLAQGVWPIAAEYMIRRPMADMFKAPPGDQERNAKPQKSRRDKPAPQAPPSPDGRNGQPAERATTTARQQASTETPKAGVSAAVLNQQLPAAVASALPGEVQPVRSAARTPEPTPRGRSNPPAASGPRSEEPRTAAGRAVTAHGIACAASPNEDNGGATGPDSRRHRAGCGGAPSAIGPDGKAPGIPRTERG